jgi:hypothetical protein
MAGMGALQHVPPELLVNMDATQFFCSGNPGEDTVWTILDKGDDEPVSVSGPGSLDAFIKFYLIMSAVGEHASDVYVVADSSLGEDEFVAHRVIGLCTSQTAGAAGWLVFTKTRSGCPSFYMWLFNNIVFPFFRELRRAYNFEDRMAALTLDGEQMQLTSLIDALRPLLSEDQIAALKYAASCSLSEQPCDVCRKFMSSKNYVRGSHELCTAVRLKNELTDILGSRPGINASQRKVLQDGLERVVDANRRSLNTTILTDGWRDSGNYPYKPLIMLRKCTSVFTEAEEEAILSKVPELIHAFTGRGMLTEKVMDDASIPKCEIVDNRTMPKDQRSLSHNRTVLVTHVKILQDDEAKRVEKVAAAARRAESLAARPAAIPSQEQGSIDMAKLAALFNISESTWHHGQLVGSLKSAFKAFNQTLPVAERTILPKKRDAVIAGLAIHLERIKRQRISEEEECVVAVIGA